MKRTRHPGPPVRMSSGFTGFRFPPEVILLAVRWYLRYGLSYRDLEELLAERGVEVDHVTLYRWVQRFTPLLIDAARPVRHLAGDRWFVDETYVKIAGVWSYAYRAVDQHGQVIDVYVSRRRDIAAARTFFTAALTVHGYPGEVITDRAPALANVVEELLPAAWHNTGQYENNRVECDHGRLKARLRPMRGVKTYRFGERGDPRARLHSEPAPRPLRARSRRRAALAVGYRIPRTQTRHLISTDPMPLLSMACDRTTQQSHREHGGFVDQIEKCLLVDDGQHCRVSRD